MSKDDRVGQFCCIKFIAVIKKTISQAKSKWGNSFIVAIIIIK
jgi:hypothetical protein